MSRVGGVLQGWEEVYQAEQRQRACWVEEPRLGSTWCLPRKVSGEAQLPVGGRKWQENEAGAAGAIKTLELEKGGVRSEACALEGSLVSYSV